MKNKRAQLLKGIAAEMVAPDMHLMYDEDGGDEYPTAPLPVDLTTYTIVARLQGYGDEADECPLDAQSLRDLADDITYDANRLHRAAQYLNRIAYREAQNVSPPKAADEIVEAWNNIYGDSTPVIYIDDNGKQCPTVTRSEASGSRATLTQLSKSRARSVALRLSASSPMTQVHFGTLSLRRSRRERPCVSSCVTASAKMLSRATNIPMFASRSRSSSWKTTAALTKMLRETRPIILSTG